MSMDRIQLGNAARQIGEIARKAPPAAGPEEAAAWQAYRRTLGEVQAKLEAVAARAGTAPAARGPGVRPAAGRPAVRPAAGRPAVRPAAGRPVPRPAAGRPRPGAGGAAGGDETMSDLSQMLQMQLQDAMNKQAQAMAMISNIMKRSHDTAMSIINNLK